MTSRRTTSRLVCLLLCLLAVAGCATVPEESPAEVVVPDRSGQSATVAEPARDLDALTVVRNFVHASAQPLSDNAGARAYLAEGIRKSWQPARGLTVIDNTFGTVYATGTQQPTDPQEQIVMLRGARVGSLAADSSFISITGVYELPIRLRQQADGQWRISDPPANLVITETDFTSNYFRVPVYFFAQSSDSTVPDLRYVPSKPQAGLAGRVIDLLLAGPSDGLTGAVRNPLGDQAGMESNVKGEADGALLVPLTGIGDQSVETKKLIVAQVVLSLQSVTTSRVRLLSDGSPLIDGHTDWLPSDLPAYAAQASPSSELPGLMVVDSRLRSLADGTPVPGPMGAGAYPLVTAAQSLDGKQIAFIENTEGRQRLRVGEFGREAQVVDLVGATMTRPTWRPVEGNAGELWTIVDGTQVVRVQRTPDNRWAPQAINADEVRALGMITSLRLSRGGSRVAGVVGGQLFVASVVRAQDSVILRAPRVLQSGNLTGVQDVDWLSQEAVVVSTSSPALPVAKVPVDGLRLDAFNSSNLTPPVYAIAAAPSRSIVVGDAGGLWTASDVGEVWRPHPYSPPGPASPLYPG